MKKFIALAVLAFFNSTHVWADVCKDRDGAKESHEGPISDHGFGLEYESMIFSKNDGSMWSVYCLKNVAKSKYAYVKWNGPEPKVLFEDFVPAGGEAKSSKSYKVFDKYDKKERKLEYGYNRAYGYSEAVDTWKISDELSSKTMLVQVQSSPLQSLGLSFKEALGSGGLFAQYLDAYAKSPEGGRYLSLVSVSESWIPADPSELERLTAGVEAERSGADVVPVIYIGRSLIDTFEKTYRWELELRIPPPGFARLNESKIIDDISISISDKPYTNLSEYKPINVLYAAKYFGELQENKPALLTGVLNKLSFEEGTGKIQEWSVALEYKGRPFSGMTNFQFEN